MYSRCIKLIKKFSVVSYQRHRLLSSFETEIKFWNSLNSKQDVSVSSLNSQHKENYLSHLILESKPKFNVVSFSKLKNAFLNTTQNVDLEKILSDPNMHQLTSDEVLNLLKMISIDSSTKTLLPISDKKYENFCTILASRVPEYSDDDISSILLYLSIWPMSESAKAGNFNLVWKALDNVCQTRMRLWSFDKLLYFIDLWYLLKLTRLSDFVHSSINVLTKKINQVSAQQLVQILFYLNAIRSAHKGITMYNLEHKLQEVASQLSLEELGIAALGFFKTRTTIRSEHLLKYIINRTIDEVQTVPEITLASILKCVRLSLEIKVWRELPRLLDSLTPQLDRFSLQCLTHVALLTSTSQTLHPPSLDYIAQKLIDNITSSRLKDMEKVLFPLSRLDYSPRASGCVYSSVVNELSQPCRRLEMDEFPRCLVALLHCLALRSIYPEHLLAHILDMDFIHNTYGPRKYFFGRELAFIDTCIELDCKDYTGPRLPPDIRSYLYGRYSHYAPSTEYKMSRHAHLAHDVMTTTQSLLGKLSAKYVYAVPSHPRADIVVGVEGLPEEYRNMPDYQGPVWAPIPGQTTCLVIVSKNMICPNSEMVKLNGETMSKLRSLRTLGYNPKLVFFNEWPLSGTEPDKEHFLEKLLFSQEPPSPVPRL